MKTRVIQDDPVPKQAETSADPAEAQPEPTTPATADPRPSEAEPNGGTP